MKRFLLPLFGTALLCVPALVSAKLVGDLPHVKVSLERQGRRSVREAARRPIWRNPSQLRFATAPLTAFYENEEFRLSIRYPSDWERSNINEREGALTLPVMFLSPTTTAAVRQNINLVVEELDSPLSLAEYTALGIKNEEMFFTDYALVSSTNVPVGGTQRGQRIIFTASTDAGVRMKFAQVWLVRGTKAYVWTFADDAAAFDRNIGTFERMLESFILR